MDNSLSALLANMGKPVKPRNVNTRLSDADFFALQTHCAKTYASYSEVIREALQVFLNNQK